MSSSPAPQSAPAAADGLLHPVPLLAIAILLLNDHVLKAAYPGFVTGKLSDVAGMVFFPLLLVALGEGALALGGRFEGPSAAAAGVAVVVTGVLFSLMKTTEAGGAAYQTAMAVLQWPFLSLARGELLPLQNVRHVVDPTDLLALPALVLPAWLSLRRARGFGSKAAPGRSP